MLKLDRIHVVPTLARPAYTESTDHQLSPYRRAHRNLRNDTQIEKAQRVLIIKESNRSFSLHRHDFEPRTHLAESKNKTTTGSIMVNQICLVLDLSRMQEGNLISSV